MSALASSARKYLGVRFRHRGRSERGLDCAGLGWIAYRDCGYELPDFRLYSREPHDDGLITYISAALGDPVYLAPIHPAMICSGDVVVLRFDVEPHHVAIVGNYRFGGHSLIHACGHNNKVIEQRMSDDMVKRITHVFRRPV